MPIIDAHMHLGECQSFLVNTEKDEILTAMRRNNVEKIMVMPFPGNPDPMKENEKILKLREESGMKIYGMTAVNPLRFGIEKTLEEIDRTVKSFNFTAIKIHTIGWGLFPFSPLADKMIEKARDLGVPVMVHTGQSLFAKPCHVDAVAKKHPDVTFILAHMGWVVDAADAINVAMNNPNVVVEASWSNNFDVAYAIQVLGAKRVLLGSDLPSNQQVEIEKIKSLNLKPDDRDLILGGNAARILKV